MVEMSKVIEIVEAAGVVPDMSKFDPSKTFRENEIDSLDVLNLFLAVEEQLGVKFSDEDASRINSVAMMLETINSH